MSSFVKYFKCIPEGGKTRIVASSAPQAILGRSGWLDFEEEYGHIIKANPQELPESEQRLYQEAHDLLRHFGHEPRLHTEIILEAEVGLEDIDVYGRNEAIQAAEVAAGLKPELLREMVWVEGAGDIPGVIVLPQDDYKRVYVLEGSRDNPTVRFVPEKNEAGGVRPYYEKPGDGKTYIYVDGFSGGSGTQEDPYLIHDVHELQAMRNNLNAHYALAQDIDASETVNWNNGAGFEPIGTSSSSSKFRGSFDGRGYKITGLYINRGSTNYVGLFGYAENATIQNVGLVDGTIVGRNYTGGVAGLVSSSSVTQCYNTGSVTGQDRTGGVVGYVASSSVTECYNTGSVNGSNRTGGIVGYLIGTSATVKECYNTGSVTGGTNTGGVVGYVANGGSVTQCYNTDSVTGITYNTGGVVGAISGGSVTQCYNTGSVTGGTYSTGGVVGYVASSGSVTQCYNTGSVTGGTNTGGVVGEIVSGTISSCYWNTETSGVSTGVGSGSASGVFGKTTAEMMQQATYVDWDFDSVWGIDEGNSYPFLRVFQRQIKVGPPVADVQVQALAPSVTTQRRAMALAPAVEVQAKSLAPSVTTQQQTKAAAPTSEAQVHSLAPSVSAQRHAEAAASGVDAHLEALSPRVLTQRQSQVIVPAASVRIEAQLPAVSAQRQDKVLAPSAAARAEAPAPAVSVQQQRRVIAPAIEAHIQASSPSVSAQRQVQVSPPELIATLEALPATVSVERSTDAQAPVAIVRAEAPTPTVRVHRHTTVDGPDIREDAVESRHLKSDASSLIKVTGGRMAISGTAIVIDSGSALRHGTTVIIGTDGKIDWGLLKNYASIAVNGGLTIQGDLAQGITLAVDSTVVRTSGAQTIQGNKTFSGSTITISSGQLSLTSSSLHMGGGSITDVNHITINNPGVNKGIEWAGGSGWKVYEAPDTLGSGAGNLQFVTGSSRRFTVTTTGDVWFAGTLTGGTVPWARLSGHPSITAGTGLTGGGSLSTSRTLSVVYGSTAGTAVEGNTQITITAGTNLSGGGTITLGAGGSVALSVVSNPTFSTSVTTPLLTHTGTLTLHGAGSSGIIAFQTNSSERMRIASSGNVGIGTSSPSETLHVQGRVLISSANHEPAGHLQVERVHNEQGNKLKVVISGDPGWQAGLLPNRSISLLSQEAASITLGFEKGQILPLVVSSQGRVGIGGKVSPQYALDVTGDVAFSGTLQAGNIPADRITSGTLGVARGGTGRSSLASGQILFGAGTSAVGLDSNLYWDNSNKRLGVGTSAPAYTLHVAGDIGFTGTLQQGTVPWARLANIPAASTSQAGIVQLNNTVTSTSTTQAATANAVKQAYDLAASKVSKAGDTMTGQLTITGNPGLKLTGGHEGLEFLGDDNYFGTNADARIIRMIDTNGSGGNVDGGLVIEAHTPTDGTSVELLRIRNNEFKWRGNAIWHSGNDGAGSGLDADLLDGQDSSYYRNASNLNAGNLNIARMPTGGNWSLSSNLTIDSSTLVVDIANDRVGIGTSSPQEQLHVAGKIRADQGIALQSSSYTIRIPSDSTSWSGGVTFYTSDGATLIGGLGLSKSPSAVQHLYMAHGSNPASSGYGIYVVPSGNVGIGTTNPAYKLDVAGDIRFTGTLQGGTVPWARLSGVPAASTSQAGIVQLNDTVTSTSTTQAATANAVKTAYDAAVARVAKSGDTMTGNLMFSGGTRYIGTSDSNNFVIRTANTDRIAITSGGNVGIGTSSPAQKLDVAGNVRTTGDISIEKNNAWMTLKSSTSGANGVEQAAGISIGESGYKGSAALHLTYTGDGYGHIGMGTVNSSTSLPTYEAIRLYYQNSNVYFLGNVGIGTGSPAQRLHVIGNIRVGDGSTSNMPIRYVSNDGVSYRIVLPVGPDKWAT